MASTTNAPTGQIDRHISDEDVFEHVILGVRLTRVLVEIRKLAEESPE